MDTTSLTAAAGLLFGLVGTGLGAWNRWDKIVEDRAKKRAGLPLVIATAGEEDAGWRSLTVTIRARGPHPYRIDSIGIIGNGNMLAPSRYDPIESPDVIGFFTAADPDRASSHLPVGLLCGAPSPGTIVVEGWIFTRDKQPEIHVACEEVSSDDISTRRKRTAISIAATVQITSSAR